jgi:hypothetical protein
MAQKTVNAKANGKYMLNQTQVKGCIRRANPASKRSKPPYNFDFSKKRE